MDVLYTLVDKSISDSDFLEYSVLGKFGIVVEDLSDLCFKDWNDWSRVDVSG